MTGPTSGLRATLLLAALELKLTARRGENVLVTIIIPVAVLAFFSNLGIGPLGTGPAAVAALLPGTVAIAIIATSLVSLGIATGYERSYGVLKRLGGAPIDRWVVVAGKILAVVVIEVGQVALLLVAAAMILGWQPPGNDLIRRATLLAVGLGLGTAAFAGLGLLLAGTLRAEATLALANALFLGFLMLGGTILPLDHLPEPLATLGRILPSAALTDVLHQAFSASAGGELLRPLLVLLAWAVGSSALAARLFRWD